MVPRKSKMDKVGDRVHLSREVLGSHYYRTRHFEEGKDFSTLAFTDWADDFVPTVIKWEHGAVDSFDNKVKTLKNAQLQLEARRRR